MAKVSLLYFIIFAYHVCYCPSGIPCCHALMTNRTRASYEMLWTSLRDAIVQRHQNLGLLHTIVFDFEGAAHDAARNILQVQTRGCLFHFGQCLIRRIKQEGAMLAYEDPQLPVREWISLIKAMALLPIDLVQLVWVNWLQHPPPVNDPHLHQQLLRFVVYFEVRMLVTLYM